MIHFKTLRERIFSILTAVIIVVAGSISYYLLYDLQSRYYKAFDNVTTAINTALVASIRESIYTYNHDNIVYMLNVIQSPYIKNLLILNTKGEVIAAQHEGNLLNKELEDFNKLLNSKTQSIKNNQQHTILNTFNIMDIPSGYLVVEGNRDYYLSEFNKELNGLLIILISFFLLTLLLTFYLSKYITQPLYSIIKTLRHTKNTEMLKFKKSPSEEEFRFLTQNIENKHNALLSLNLELEEKIEEKVAELKRLNENLEHRVKEAVEEAKSREKLLHKQTRLAQMGEMISMIAHQWRQPLAAISSTMMLVERHIETDKFALMSSSKSQDFIEFINEKHEHIYNNIEYLASTTDDFREFFNPNSTKEHLSVNTPIQKALMLIEKSITNNGIKLNVNLQSVSTHTFYQNEIMQVILNLLKNANDALIEHNHHDKSIWVSSYDTKSEIIIKIKDNGIGISKENEEHIFDPYFSTKIHKIGTGLGLYMSKNIIEDHNNGQLVYQKEENQTCFVIRFPLTEAK